ncbi:hypothetical protein NIES4102_02020 [Chondrocystis sp. NIES-4102]|nr:hypothetical protein NIES4102_02020 [Chondrocystis sp. NIES-4102]
MNSDKKFALLVLGIPLVGLVYCGLGILAMSSSVTVRDHPIVSGAIFILLPFSIAAYTWISASAKAYRR